MARDMDRFRKCGFVTVFHIKCHEIALPSDIHASASYERIPTQFDVPALAWSHLTGYDAILATGDNARNLVICRSIVLVIDIL